MYTGLLSMLLEESCNTVSTCPRTITIGPTCGCVFRHLSPLVSQSTTPHTEWYTGYLMRVKISQIIRSFIPPLWSSGQSSWLHNWGVLRFLWGTNWIYICYVEESVPPLCSSGQGSWLHNGEVLWFLWGTIWIYICFTAVGDPPHWPCDTLSIRKSWY
jgi:hypothetical protein